jgi:hypothetical protein
MKERIRKDLGDGSSWPTLEEGDRLNWQLRYGKVTRSDELGGATYCDAYCELIRATEKRRKQIVRALKPSKHATRTEE